MRVWWYSPRRDTAAHPDTMRRVLLRELVDASAAVRDSSARSAKVERLAELLRRTGPERRRPPSRGCRES